ncbi:glucodextranase DOMON-like domain-containing protein [Thermococcus zilligii]|uniref:glucodextranase DOMON-like domain-containing protein n=1 Tax=Thermococcus zilligii TaxID=54076 RepID=UPI001ED92951|nr:glucodextranase DOMON-like domain-containing protein [Thermococcus zilligii]
MHVGHKRKALYSAAMVLLLLGSLFGFIKPGAATPEAGSFWVATYQAESGSIASITYGSSGAVLVGSIAGAGVGSSNAWIAKISDDGSPVWQKAAVGGQVLSDVEINGTYYVAVGRYNNTNAWIVKFDENGNIVWQKAIGGAEDTKAVAVSGNSFVGSYNGRPWIVIFADDGSVVWEKTLNGDGNYSFADVVMDVYKSYKYYYVVGWTNGTNVTQNDAWIVKFRGDGKVVFWQKRIAGSGDEKATSAIMIPGGVLVSIVTDNGTILAKFHYFGNFTWAKFYPDVRINRLINTGYDVVAVGELGGKGFAMRTDYDGSVIKAVTYETDEMGVFNAVAFDANTNATLIGGRLDGQAFAIRAPLEDLTVPSCGIVKDVAITPEDVNLTIVDTNLTLGNVNSAVVDTSVDFVETTAGFTRYMLPKLVASVADVVGDDYGPGTYTYPTNPVFNQTGLFDIIGVTLYEGSDGYILQVHFANLGGNPWSGWNGFSLQIVEAYFDFKEGGTTSAIKLSEKGPGANVNLDRPWDVAIRVTGWTSKLVLPDMSTIDINATANLTTNTIIITIPKEYLNVTPDTYFAVIAGSQDGFGIDDWRSVEVQAAEWRIGGGDPDAIIAGVAPRVMDLLASPEFRPTQEEQLTSYNASETNPERATIVMIPLAQTSGGGGETPTTTTDTTTTSTETTTPTTTTTTSPVTTTVPTSTPVTVTKTVTRTETVTKTETMTRTVTDTVTETVTHTATSTETRTETVTKTETTTKTETKTETTGGGGICGPAAIIGLTAIPLLLRKKR